MRPARESQLLAESLSPRGGDCDCARTLESVNNLSSSGVAS